MKQYIDKDIIVAELKHRIKECDNLANAAADNNLSNTLQANELLIRQYTSLLHFLNTLEVKEVDLENSMTCNVDWYDGFLLDYTQEQQDTILEKLGLNVGDKVRVILIKE